MQELVDGFIDYKTHNQGRSRRTADLYRLALSRFETFLEGRDPLLATQEDLLFFCGLWLHKQGINPVNRHTYVSAIREFYKWLLSTRRIASSPAALVPYPAVGFKIPRVMTMESAEKLLWAPEFSTFTGVRDCAILALLLGCGLRASGLVNLNVSNVVEDVVDGARRLVLRVLEKGDRERRIPVPPQAAFLLRVYMEHPDLKEIDRALPKGDEVLFVSTRNRSCPPHEYRGEKRRLNRRALIDMMAKYGERAGVPADQLHPHAMRHLYGTELAEGDVDLLIRQRLMGHADPKSTMLYSNLALRKLTKESDRANPLSKMNTPVTAFLRKMKS
jgi:integrase/recombinase XerD